MTEPGRVNSGYLQFGGTQVLDTKIDTFHVFGGYSVVKRDRRGAWMFGATVNLSPGNINSRNTDEALELARSGAEARYVYGTLAVQRLLSLSHGWDLFSRAVVQRSTHNLAATEQLAIGGSGSVRGYDPNIFAGEMGWVLNHDLMAPVWRQKLPFLRKIESPLETRFLGFLDMAKVNYRKTYGSDIILAAIASTGVGLRSSLGNNFNVTFDYGWQLMHLPRQGGQPRAPKLGSQGNIKVVLAF